MLTVQGAASELSLRLGISRPQAGAGLILSTPGFAETSRQSRGCCRRSAGSRRGVSALGIWADTQSGGYSAILRKGFSFSFLF